MTAVNDRDDEALALASRDGDSAALDLLLRRYKGLVKSKAASYYIIGGDRDDLIQEGMIGLYKAVGNFNPEKAHNFHNFASLCISRQIMSAIKASARQKHKPLNTSLSLNESGDGRETFLEYIPDSRANDPEALLIGRETYNTIGSFIQKHLSKLEYDVLMLHFRGKSHAEIAYSVGKNEKSIDNTLQRIRRKIGKNLRDTR